MRTAPDISAVAALIGDPTRAAVLSLLLGGQSLPAGELARRTFVTPQTMSMHLARLVEGGLLTVTRTGRHRYFGIRNAEVAATLEALALLSPPPQPKTREESAEHKTLCFARTCYDHLAGTLGVMVTRALVERGYVTLDDGAASLTADGSAWLRRRGIDETALRVKRRVFACTCIDWSERREHLAGALGAALTAKMFEDGWIARLPGGRAVRLTDAGRAGLKRELDVVVLAPSA